MIPSNPYLTPPGVFQKGMGGVEDKIIVKMILSLSSDDVKSPRKSCLNTDIFHK